MKDLYGKRYIEESDFINYCKFNNVLTNSAELEYYEKSRIMFPAIRITYPEEYIHEIKLFSHYYSTTPPDLGKWPDLEKLLNSCNDKDSKDFSISKLIHCFDNYLSNPHVLIPSKEQYKPWSNFKTTIQVKSDFHSTYSTITNYYCYWQIHQLFFIQQFPDLYKNKEIIDCLSKDQKLRLFVPRTKNYELYQSFNGLDKNYDELSFWIYGYSIAKEYAFSTIPVKHNIQRLTISQYDDHQKRLKEFAEYTQKEFNGSIDSLYYFLNKLVELFSEYQNIEKIKLTKQVKYDILHTVEYLGVLTGKDWDQITVELNKRKYPFWIVNGFRQANRFIGSHDKAFDILQYYSSKYVKSINAVGIKKTKINFEAENHTKLLDYCLQNDLFHIIFSLSNLLYDEENITLGLQNDEKYIILQNCLISVEYLLRNFVSKHLSLPKYPTFDPLIKELFKNTKWYCVYKEINKELNTPISPIDYHNCFEKIQQDKRLYKSEEKYWAKVFLTCYTARNLTIHTYTLDDWLFGNQYEEIINSSVYAILYIWYFAIDNGWI